MIALQTDGRIVMAGYAGGGIAVARYNTDGALDISFGGDGVVTASIGSVADYASAVAVQPDGKIVVAGASQDAGPFADTDFVLLRYNVDGGLDSSFGGDGSVTTAGVGADVAAGVAVQSDGRIVVVGSSIAFAPNSDYDLVLLRYLPDGSLDPSFGGDGKIGTPFGVDNDIGAAVALQPDGKIVVVGEIWLGAHAHTAIARFNADGSLDSTFSGDGFDVLMTGSDDAAASAVLVQPDGKIVVGGFANRGGIAGQDYVAVLRLSPSGSPDTAFGIDGVAIGSFRTNGAKAIALQPDGRIVVAGNLASDGRGLFAARFTSSGEIDTTFNCDGVASASMSATSVDLGYAMAIQADGRIVVGGQSSTGVSTSTVALVRYLGDYLGSPCSATPQSGCLAATKSLLMVKDEVDDGRDRFQWKWLKGVTLTAADLADPTSGSEYTLCVYAGSSNALVAETTLPPGPQWKSNLTGYTFKSACRDGVTKSVLKDGPAGRSKALATGKGAGLHDISLPLTYPVTVQLKRDSSAICLESVFASVDQKRNSATQFKAIR